MVLFCSVMEVVTQIGHRFKVEPAEIKKVRDAQAGRFHRSTTDMTMVTRLQSISSLIDREYMKRSESSLNTFEYVA